MDYLPFMWLGVLVLAAVLEAVTAQLVSIWFVAGSLSALIASLFIPDFSIQLIIFVAVSLVLLAASRPFVRKLKSSVKVTPTNADRNIGEIAVVLEDIDPTAGTGQVKVGGNVWSAKSFVADTIPKGSEVVVKEITGVKLVVEPKPE